METGRQAHSAQSGFGDDNFNVSVAMATYNGARYIQEQLKSLAAQTFLPLELVVSDDGSTDATVRLIQEFAATAPFRVKINQNKQNLGFADNFMKAAELTSGNWVAFSDQDDVWEPDKLQMVKAAIAQDTEIGLVAHPSRILKDGNRTEKMVGPQVGGMHVPLTQDPLQVYNGHCLIFRRALLDALPAAQRPFSVHTPSRRMPHDDWITFLGSTLGKTLILPEALVCYRHHAGNVSEAFLRQTGLREYMRRGVLSSGAEVEKCRQAAQDRATQLQNVATKYAYVQANAQRAAVYYQGLADLSERRLELWRGRSIVKRIARLAGLIRHGAYLGYARGGVGRREAFKDALFGVITNSQGRRVGS